jgi:hypothetical protein
MSQTSSPATAIPAGIPSRFLLRFGILVREVHGLPDPDYAASRSSALKLFRNLARVQYEDAARRVLSRDQAGTLSLLCAIIGESNQRGVPLSLPDIAAAKKEDSEWVRQGFQDVEVQWFFRRAIHHMDSPAQIPEKTTCKKPQI